MAGKEPETNGGIRILLVAVNPDLLRVTEAYLQRQDELIVVGAFRDNAKALARAPHLQPQVILLDLDLPGRSGLEAIPRFRRVAPEAWIIAMALLDGQGYREAAMTGGADDFVVKADIGVELLPAIREVVQSGSGRSTGPNN